MMPRRVKTASGVVAAVILASQIPASQAEAYPGEFSSVWQTILCLNSPIKCGQVKLSATAAADDLSRRPPRVDGRWRDGTRDNAFLHSSWNARAAVVTGDRGYVRAMSTEHEAPLTSANPPGTRLVDRHERVDLCNNMYGSNKPSNWQLIAKDQMTAVNSLWAEAGNLREDSSAPEAMDPSDACYGDRLMFIRKNNGVCFGVDPNLGATYCENR